MRRSRRLSPEAIFWCLVFGNRLLSSTQSERGALVGPVKRDASQQQLDGQGAWLAALDDGLHDVGGQISKPQKPADVGIAELKALRNLGGVNEFALSQPAHP